MKGETVSGLVVGLALALVVGIGLAVWLIGAETLRTMGIVFAVGLALALVICAVAFLVRAYRKNDNPPVVEKHIYHEGRQIIRERVIDSRPAPTPQLPPPTQPPLGVFPELLRASYQAGRLAASRGDVVDAEVREVPADGWDGDIMQ